MTDEIIIDGIDVSECEFYCEEYCNLSNDRNERLPFAEKCTEYSDCCYKQLKRKEQECHKYKQALDEITESLIPICDSCRKYYYNQHCEDCDTGYIKDIINEAKEA